MSDFAATLDTLWELQKLDQIIAEGLRDIASSEKAVVEATNRVQTAGDKLKQTKDATNELRRKHKEVEEELARLDKRIEKLESQGGVAGITAADKQREHIDEFEMEGLELLDEIPANEKAETKLQEELERQQSLLAESTERVVVVAEKSLPESESAKVRRRELLPTIAEPILEKYENAQAKHAGSAICYSKDEVCQGCSGGLTRAHESQVRNRNEVILCPHCYRIHDIKS